MAELGTWEIIGRLTLAAVLGAMIGVEREIDGQDAGLRTHLMLALGAALFGAISVGAWDTFHAARADSNVNIDVTRVASYVAAGIGFLGGGAIVKQAGGVRGLTTASSLWVAAAVGLAAGVGFVVPAIAATGAALLSLAALRPVRSLIRRIGDRPGTLTIVMRDDSVLAAVAAALHEDGSLAPVALRAGPGEHADGYQLYVEFGPNIPPEVLARGAARLSGVDGVREVHVGR